jgi:hypothetical protein
VAPAFAVLDLGGATALGVVLLAREIPAVVSSFDWLGSVTLNPLGYALIGPLSAAAGTAETLAGAAALNVSATLGVLLVPSVRRLPPGRRDRRPPRTRLPQPLAFLKQYHYMF